MAKDGFYAMCKSFGVAYPELWESRREDLGALAAHIPYPVMVKPARIHDVKKEMRGRKGWTIASAEELRRLAPAVPEGAGTLIVQEIVPGPESAITLACVHAAADGSHRHLFTARKLRQYPPGFGSASLVQSAPEPETAEITAHILKSAGYRGIASSEFKRDPATGKLKIIEINVRPALWFSVSQASGRPVVLSAYRELAGEDPIPEAPQVNGVRWRYGLKDLWSSWFYSRNPGFVLPPPNIEAVGPAIKSETPVASLNDPMPMVAEVAGFVEKGVRRALAPVLGRDKASGDGI
jgi:predicted ATP-grasp superfamily ATP-dependent carboligase